MLPVWNPGWWWCIRSVDHTEVLAIATTDYYPGCRWSWPLFQFGVSWPNQRCAHYTHYTEWPISDGDKRPQVCSTPQAPFHRTYHLQWWKLVWPHWKVAERAHQYKNNSEPVNPGCCHQQKCSVDVKLKKVKARGKVRNYTSKNELKIESKSKLQIEVY